jgi:carboxyl-terminal processing protease
MNKKWKIWLPVFFGMAIAIGIIVGNLIAKRAFSGNGKGMNSSYFSKTSKLETILGLIDADYVEDVNVDSLSEDLIPKLLANLDPHSVYIPASDMEMANEDLDGSFSGIGVQFNIQTDTVMVVSVIHGGPSDKLGILPGDRIVSVNDSAFVGKKITNERVMKKLRGKKGSKVKLGIKRRSSAKILTYVVTRGDVPVKSVDSYYMLAPQIGYIKVSNFGSQTYKEFIEAINKLHKSGAQKYVVDLRGNPGGLMDAATNMVNEFLKKGSLIVYTKGKSYPRKDIYANGNGTCQKADLVVLIDEWSASASEIFAGAMQDNDRAVIIGRRSFGKGLVQQQIPFNDGSAVRLTVARYYTPSGRCIQKPYKKGDVMSYEKDIMNRYIHGEFNNKDSIKISKALKYKTVGGRTVYGGGGIMADIFIPKDTSSYTPYFNKVVDAGYIYEFAFQYADNNRAKLKQYKNWQSLYSYLEKQPMLVDFAEFAEKKKGVKKNIHQILKSASLIEQMIYSYVAKDAAGDEAYYPIVNSEDDCLKEAIKQLKHKVNLTAKK